MMDSLQELSSMQLLRITIWAILIWALTVNVVIAAPISISVMDLRVTSGISTPEGEQLTAKLLNEMVICGAFNVVDRLKRDQILIEQGFQMTGACDQSSCLVEAGQLLGVEKMIGGSLGKVGTVYSADLQMVDVQTGKIDIVFSRTYEGKVSRMIDIMREAARVFSRYNAEHSNKEPINNEAYQIMLPISGSSQDEWELKYSLPDTLVKKSDTLSIHGLMAYYPFNGNTLDESGNGHNGKPFRVAQTQNRFGKNGKAYHFNGKESTVKLPSANNIALYNSSFSVSVWVMGECFEDEDNDHAIMGMDNPANSGCLHLIVRYRKPMIGFYFNDTYADAICDNDKWYHFVFTYDKSSGMQKIYVNGILKASSPGHQPMIGAGPVYIGRWCRNRYFKGIIDDIRIYNRVLSNKEIQLLFHEGGWE